VVNVKREIRSPARSLDESLFITRNNTPSKLLRNVTLENN